MKIWLCKHSEDIPLNNKDRKFRVGMLSDQLVNRKHEVQWWTSDYNHYKKQKLSLPLTTYNGVNLKVSNVIAYEKNLSWQRIYNHYQIGKYFSKESYKTAKPDIIYASMPTLDFAYRAAQYASKNNIPFVLDIRDLWPDVFLDLIPFKVLRKEWVLIPWNNKLNYILKNADAIIGITEEYLNWGLKKANIRLDEKKHRVFPLGYEKIKGIDLETKPEEFTITFVGTVGYHFDLETILKAAEILKDKDINFKILGDGDLLNDFKSNYIHLPKVTFTGHVSGENLVKELKTSHVGVAPYRNSKNFKLNIPNKPYEYIAYGMPILTCLEGPTRSLVEDNNIGIVYKEENPNSLAEKILFLYENPDLYKAMSLNALKVFYEKYEKEKVYESFVDFLELLVKESKCKEV